jgi:hypothetical protein
LEKFIINAKISNKEQDIPARGGGGCLAPGQSNYNHGRETPRTLILHNDEENLNKTRRLNFWRRADSQELLTDLPG